MRRRPPRRAPAPRVSGRRPRGQRGGHRARGRRQVPLPGRHRGDPHTTAYAQWLLSLGSEVRTAPVLPQRLVIIDRTQALVPIDPADTRKGALHVTEPGIVGALVGLFEQAWATAVPLGAVRTEDPTTGLNATERELLRLLGSGLTDDTAGQRLGLSSRTVSRHMSSIMERLGAASRFEAGIKAAQRGWI